MDLVLSFCDRYLLTERVYPHWLPEDNIGRQFVSLTLIVTVGGALLYLITAAISFIAFFDKTLMKHRHFKKNQVWREICHAMQSIPPMAVLCAVAMLPIIRGHSRIYGSFGSSGILWEVTNCCLYFLFADTAIFWVHRAAHTRALYTLIHKQHHQYVIATPFASHAFNPIDGFLMGIPYILYPYFFPVNKTVYLIAFIFSNLSAVTVHDGSVGLLNLVRPLKPLIISGEYHDLHHKDGRYNMGHLFTFWDRVCSTYRDPSSHRRYSQEMEDHLHGNVHEINNNNPPTITYKSLQTGP